MGGSGKGGEDGGGDSSSTTAMDLTSKLLDSDEDMENPALTEFEDDIYSESVSAFAAMEQKEPLTDSITGEIAATPRKATGRLHNGKLP